MLGWPIKISKVRLGWPIKIFKVRLGWPTIFFEGLVKQAGRMYPSPANNLWDYGISLAKLGLVGR